MRLIRLLALGMAAFLTVCGHDIITTKLTFTRDISRIFIRRCQSCHAANSSIPLTTYEEARPWAVSIKEQVLSRQMPPWGAVKGFGHLSPDNSLTQEEMLIIAAWVVGGAPKGDASLLPPAPFRSQSPPQSLAFKDALIVTNKSTIETPLEITGIRPIAREPIASARITVNFPDGHVEPLLWLYQYNPAWQKTFHFREPISLPKGAVVQSGSPLQFALVKPDSR